MITAVVLSPAIDKIYFIDNFRSGGLFRVNSVVKSAGGKGINVARVSSILGEKVKAIGFKAGDSGEWLESKLTDIGVQTRFIHVDGESRTNNNIVDRSRNMETEILESGPNIQEEKIEEFLNMFDEEIKNTNVLVCSGRLPEGIPVDFYRKLIERAKSSGAKVILDSSSEMLKEGIKAKPFMVKPNLRELSSYAGRKLNNLSEIIEVCKEIISSGVEVVVASLGKQGALMVRSNKILFAKTPEVEEVNTIGSGDCMVAGIASGLERELSLEEAFRLGVACAVANTQFVEIGFVTQELVDRFLKEVCIERVR